MAVVVCSVLASSSPGCCCRGAPSVDVSMGSLPRQPRGLLQSPFPRTEQSPNEFHFTSLRIVNPPNSLAANHELSNRKYTSVHLPFSIPVPIRSTFSSFSFPPIRWVVSDSFSAMLSGPSEVHTQTIVSTQPSLL
jgi:hypothetical protein